MDNQGLISNEPIRATIVNEADRIAFLPSKFPKLYMRFERCVFGHAQKLIEGYNGGYWEFVDLSNGGLYLKLSFPEQVVVNVDGNYFSKEVSSEVAGIIVTAFALSYLYNQTYDEGTIELLYKLNEYINEHPCRRDIRAAMD